MDLCNDVRVIFLYTDSTIIINTKWGEGLGYVRGRYVGYFLRVWSLPCLKQWAPYVLCSTLGNVENWPYFSRKKMGLIARKELCLNEQLDFWYQMIPINSISANAVWAPSELSNYKSFSNNFWVTKELEMCRVPIRISHNFCFTFLNIVILKD